MRFWHEKWTFGSRLAKEILFTWLMYPKVSCYARYKQRRRRDALWPDFLTPKTTCERIQHLGKRYRQIPHEFVESNSTTPSGPGSIQLASATKGFLYQVENKNKTSCYAYSINGFLSFPTMHTPSARNPPGSLAFTTFMAGNIGLS